MSSSAVKEDFLKALAGSIPADLTDEMMASWLQSPEALMRRLAMLQPPESGEGVTSYVLPPLRSMRTTDCFRSSGVWYSHSASDYFNQWLPKEQPSTDECRVVVRDCQVERTGVEFAQAILGVDASSPEELGRMLLESEHVRTLTQIVCLMEDTVLRKATGIGDNAVFFVATAVKTCPVMPVRATHHRKNHMCSAVISALSDTSQCSYHGMSFVLGHQALGVDQL